MKARYTFALLVLFATLAFGEYASRTVYFPPGAEHWYPQYLEAMREPSLFEESTNKTVEQYRFLWLRTFDKPIAVRMRKDAAGMTLRVVRLSGKGCYDPGHIERDDSFSVTLDEWNEFLKLLEKSSFWDFPATEINLTGVDGSQWILEGRAGGKYHSVDRWTPSENDDKRELEKFVACCRYLLELSKEEAPKKDDY